MRDRRLELWTLVLLATLGAFVWLTRHPDAGLVRRAEKWRLVGSLATAFRERWSPSPAEPLPPAEPPVVEYVYIIESDGPTPGRSGAGKPEAPRGPTPPRPEAGATVAVSGQTPVLPGAPRAAEAELVDRARRLLRGGGAVEALGGYTLLTDVHDPALLERWRRIVTAVEPAWRERYGLVPIGAPAESIALFARARAFRDLQRSVPTLGALDANGFTFGGLVALATEGMSDEQIDGTFQHELAHLLTRRSIGPALPAWLAEGLAEDFGQATLAESGLDFDAVRGSVTRDGNRFELRGGIAFFDRLLRAFDRAELPTPLELAQLGEEEFSSGEAGLDRYAAAFAWTRFLLATPTRAKAVRGFLAGVARGEMPTSERLEGEIGASWRALLPELGVWLVELRDRSYRRAGVPIGPRWGELDDVPRSPLPEPSQRDGASGSVYRTGAASGAVYRTGAASGSSSRHPSVPSV